MLTIRPLRRWFAAVLATLAWSAAAAAGPMIPYQYASTFSQWGSNPLWASLTPTFGGSVNGTLDVTQASTVGYALPTPLNQPAQGASPFLLNVTLTDQLSGDAETFTFAGTAFEQDLYSGGRLVHFGGLSSALAQTKKIGDDYFYTVDLELRRGADGRQYVDALVTIETPEPASLALAGLGLAGLAGARLRNRKTSAGA